jgi:hypothetical protein
MGSIAGFFYENFCQTSGIGIGDKAAQVWRYNRKPSAA